MSALHSAVETAWHMLENWFEHTEGHWHELPGLDGSGHYGSGYNEWGVQTNQKFAGAMCALAHHGHSAAFRRAVAALRFHA